MDHDYDTVNWRCSFTFSFTLLNSHLNGLPRKCENAIRDFGFYTIFSMVTSVFGLQNLN